MRLIEIVFSRNVFYPTLVAAALFAAIGAASIWAAVSRRHWFLRTAVVGGAVSLALLVPGYDAVLIGFTQAVFAVFWLTLMRAWRLRAARGADEAITAQAPIRWTRPQFSLTDLLLATVVLSAVLAVASRVPKSIWSEWLGIGMMGLLLGGFTVPFAGKRSMGPKAVARFEKRGKRARVTLAFLVYVPLPCYLLFLVCPVVAVYHIAINPTPLPRPVLPDPNGYDDLVRAGRPLINLALPDAETATAEELNKFVTAHRRALRTARQGLARECRVPLTYTPADLTRNYNEAIRQLGRAFVAEGRLAELEGRTGDAVESYLDTMRLGQAAAGGGVAIEALIGWALDGIGVDRLASLTESLTADQCREVIDVAGALDADREPLEDVIARESLWWEHAYGKTGRVLTATGISPLPSDDVRLSLGQSSKRSRARLRLLTCELALRRYRLERGGEPAKLADLVPEYLPELPIDPFSGRPLIYQPEPTGHRLYSVGPDGVDDGGKAMERQLSSEVWPGDLLLVEPVEKDAVTP